MRSEITAVGSLTQGDKRYGHTDDRVNENYAIKIKKIGQIKKKKKGDYIQKVSCNKDVKIRLDKNTFFYAMHHELNIIILV